MALIDPVPWPHFTQLSRDADTGLQFDDTVFFDWQEPGNGVTIVKTGDIDVSWTYQSVAIATMLMNQGAKGTLLYTPDSGETWHVYDTNVTLWDGVQYVEAFPGHNLPTYGLTIPSATDLGSESDQFYFKLILNDSESVEISSPGLIYVWTA